MKESTKPPTCRINLFSIPGFFGRGLDEFLEAFVVDVRGRPLRDLVSWKTGTLQYCDGEGDTVCVCVCNILSAKLHCVEDLAIASWFPLPA